MKAYRFRLAAVARIRALEERAARDRLMVALRDLRQARETEGATASALTAAVAPTGSVTMGQVIWAGDQGERLAGSLRTSREAVRSAEAVSVQARRRWTVAAKRSGVLDRLDQQGLARWREETRREEAAELDEVANARTRGLGGGR